MTLLTPQHDFGTNADGLFLKTTQEIPDEFLATLRETKDASGTERCRELHRVACIPTAVADRWMALGFNVFEEKAPAILSRLRAEHLDAFIVTNKRV